MTGVSALVGPERTGEQRANPAGVPIRGAALPPRATPAGAVTGANASTASRGTAKASTTGRAAAEVPGTDITAIGDSVMLASSLALQQAFPGIYIDAVVSRHTYAGLSVLRQPAASGGLRLVVIIGLGTNGGGDQPAGPPVWTCPALVATLVMSQQL